MSECSFADRDMFMRYLHGGIGHIAATQPKEGNIDIDENANIPDEHEVTGASISELNDHLLLEELRRAASMMADGGTANDWEEVVDASDSDSHDDQDSDTDSMDEDTASDASTDGEDDDDLGPEDGEDEGYVDSGYGAP
jgi:hypothetical protein